MARLISTQRAKNNLVHSLNYDAENVFDRCLPDAGKEVISRHTRYCQEYLLKEPEPDTLKLTLIMAVIDAALATIGPMSHINWLIDSIIQELETRKP